MPAGISHIARRVPCLLEDASNPLTTVGIDLAKNVFQVHAVDERGTVVLRKQLRRDQMTAFFMADASLGQWLVTLPLWHFDAATGGGVHPIGFEDRCHRRSEIERRELAFGVIVGLTDACCQQA